MKDIKDRLISMADAAKLLDVSVPNMNGILSKYNIPCTEKVVSKESNRVKSGVYLGNTTTKRNMYRVCDVYKAYVCRYVQLKYKVDLSKVDIDSDLLFGMNFMEIRIDSNNIITLSTNIKELTNYCKFNTDILIINAENLTNLFLNKYAMIRD